MNSWTHPRKGGKLTIGRDLKKTYFFTDRILFENHQELITEDGEIVKLPYPLYSTHTIEYYSDYESKPIFIPLGRER